MKHSGLIRTTACAALVFGALSTRPARADNWDRKTTISFSDDVRVPGTTLQAGKYVFKLLDSPSNRYVVQIFNERQNHIYATVMAIPEYRTNAPDKTIVSFYEAPAGQPQPIKTWFYPGDNNGREFVYSRAEANVIASAAHQAVPTEGSLAAAQSTTPAPAVAESTETEQSTEDAHAAPPAPAPQPAAEPEVKQESPMVTDDAAEDQTPQPPAEPAPAPAPQDNASMPSTASELPLAALIGLSSIAAALSLRAIRRLS